MRKKLFNDQGLAPILKRYIYLAALLLMANVWGQTSATVTFSTLGLANSTVLPSGNIDSNISYTPAQNSGSVSPTYFTSDSAVRFYTNGTPATPYNGGSITLSANNGVTITGVELYAVSGNTPTLRYSIGAAATTASDPTISLSSTTYSVSGLSITSSIKIRNANTSSVQLRSTGIKVTYTLPGITSTASGNWADGSTWVGGVVPTSSQNVIIASGHTVTVGAALIRNSGTTTTVTGTLATAATYTNDGTTNINGVFQINAGGYANGTNNLIYGAAGTLIFNHSNSSDYGVSGGSYWPSTNGPVNVTLNTNSPINLGLARAVTGVFATSAPLKTASNLTVNGTNQINSTSASFDSAVNYGASSTLLYNSGSTFNRGNEWNNSPNNVTLQNSTVLNYPNGWGGNFTRTLNGNLSVGTGSALYMDYGSPGTGVGTLTVKGNVLANGNITLGNQSGGDLVVGGNFTNAATFNANGRKVTFNGSASQSITGATSFAYLDYNSSAGTNVLTVNNNITVGNELRFTAGLVSLASGLNVNIANNASIVATSGNFNSASTNGTVNFLGTGTTTGTINFYPAVVQAPSSLLGVSYSTGSTIQGTLTLNSNSYVTSAPKYATGSALVYNNTGTYARGVEWGSVGTTFPANGYPYNVTIQNGTTLKIATGLGGALRLAGNLNLGVAASAGSLDMENTANVLQVAGNVNLGNTTGASTLSLSTNVGGDLSVGGNWVKNSTNGVLVSNNRTVAFNGTTAQTLTGATTFDYLTINNSTGLTLNNAVNINQALNLTLGKITLGTNDFTIAASGSISGGSTSSYIVTNSTGSLKWLAVGNVDKIFPVGKDTTYYAPLTIRNTNGTSDLSVKVNDAITNAVYVSGSVVAQEWLVNSSSSTIATITPAWAGAKQPGGITNPGSGELGNYVGSYTVYPTSLVATPQNQTTATGVAISSGNNYIVVGSTGAVYTAPPANDTCSGTVPILVANDPVTHGTLNGATKTGAGATFPDVFYKFTPSVTGTYSITINNFSAGDRDLYIYTSCPSAVPGSVVSGYSGTISSTISETVTNTFTNGTTYYIAVYDYQTAKGTFDIRVTANPILTVIPTSIAFGTVNSGSLTSHSFNLMADLLTLDAVTPANNKIVVTAPAGYKVSLNNSTWSTSVDVPYATSSLASTSIYVIVDGATTCGSTAGNITFATANLVTSPTVALTATFVVPASTATAATGDTATNFTANWGSVAGATGYVLDVSAIPTFGTSSSASASEGFESGLPTSGYSTGAYSLTSGTWNLTDGLRGTSGVKTGSYSLQLKASTGVATTPVLNGINSVTIWATRGSTATTLVVNKIVGGVTTQIWSQALTTTTTQYTIPVNDASSNVQLQFVIGSGFCNIDDVVINYTSITPSFVTGYNGLDVSGTSHLVSNLTPNTTYYYRVRALSGSCQSLNSNVITTTTNNTVVWGGNAWSNISGPTTTLDAIVRGNYSTATTGNFTAKDLTVENTGKVTVGSGNYVKVEGVLTINNNVAKDNFVIMTGGDLLQTSTVANNLNGIIQAQRSVTGINNNLSTAMDYVYWSSPVSGQRTNTSGGEAGFSPGTPANRFYEYNEAKDTFKATADAYFTAGKGYAVRAETGLNPDTNANYTDGYAKTYKFNGVPNNGDITFGLTRTKAGAATSGVGLGFNMIGNPYPSNINFEELHTANSSVIYNTAYFWTNNVFTATQGGAGYAQNNYAVYNGVGGNPASEPTQAAGGSGDTTVPNGLVSVGQGFIVQAKNQGTSSLNFKNSYSSGHDLRVASSAHFFQKQSSEAKNRFWIKLKSPHDLTNTQLIGYVSGASNGFEQDYDAETLSTSSDVFYSILGSRQLLIQGRSENFIASDVVPVGANFYQDGTYSIGLDKVEGIFENGQKVYLRDNLLGKTVDLSQGDYSFTAGKGLNNTRFDIVYKESGVLGIDGLSKSDFTVYRDGDHYVVNSTKKLGKIEVYDTSGRMMRGLNSAEMMIRIDMSDFPNGVYILKVENSRETKTKKIIK